MNEVISILIVDDHPVVRDGLVAILATQPDFRIVGEAASGSEALSLFEQYQPDVILLDLEMPDMDGVTVIRQIREKQLKARIVVFTAFDTDERILSAVQAGAKGYLLKGVPRSDLFKAIRVVHQGGSLLQPVVASRLLKQISATDDEPELPEELTARESQVLTLLAQGNQNKEIALELSISERTVKFHISSILSKLGAGNRTEAVSIAVQKGLIEL
jgi:DNA-binding NarL/FixJ family response regulator